MYVYMYCNVFIVQEYMPVPPEDNSTSPKLQFSVVECALFSFHQLVRKVPVTMTIIIVLYNIIIICSQYPDFFTLEENSDRLKEFRLRLQYFARGSQTYHGQLQVALKGKTALELKEEQVRSTAN